MKEEPDLARVLKDLRLIAGITQQQMADEIGVTRTMLSLWENSKAVPTTKHYFRWLAAAKNAIDAIEDLGAWT